MTPVTLVRLLAAIQNYVDPKAITGRKTSTRLQFGGPLDTDRIDGSKGVK